MAEPKPTAAPPANDADLVREANAALRALIEASLARRYVSTSSHEGIKTGNRYQSVQLGDDQLDGFRNSRAELFQVFNFSGRSVLDCGSNIGEMSRLARRRGAKLVDGYEFDPYFVAIGRMINALNGVSRVSFYEKDLTKDTAYEDTFDIALAFSVFPYISQTLKALCEHVKDAIVLETHDIKPNLYPAYIERFKPYFPHHSFVAVTDHSKGQGQRAIIVLAKNEATLCQARGILRSTVDLTKSKFEFIEQTLGETRSKGGVDSISRLIASGWGSEDKSASLSGKRYWRLMAEGYLRYRERGGVGDDNPYLPAFLDLYYTANADPALKKAIDTDGGKKERIERRFKDMDALAGNRSEGVAPVRAVDISLAPARKHTLKHGEFDQLLYCDALDGYHRIFWATFLGRERLDCLYTVGASLCN